MYKPPIEIIRTDLFAKLEEGIFQAVQQQGIFVHKDDLLRALKGDMASYHDGEKDGKHDAIYGEINLRTMHTPETTKQHALHFLRKKLIGARVSLQKATRKPGAELEAENLRKKIRALEWLIEIAAKEAE